MDGPRTSNAANIGPVDVNPSPTSTRDRCPQMRTTPTPSTSVEATRTTDVRSDGPSWPLQAVFPDGVEVRRWGRAAERRAGRGVELPRRPPFAYACRVPREGSGD